MVHDGKPIKARPIGAKFGTPKANKAPVNEAKKKPFKCIKCYMRFKSMERLKGHAALYHEVTKPVGMDDSMQELAENDDEINVSDEESIDPRFLKITLLR